MTTYVIFGFDMETDIGSYLKSYNGVRQGTSRILNILERFSIPATFFFTGETARDNPETVKAVVRAGHEAGCHGLKHETVGDSHFNMPGDCSILPEEAEHRLILNKKIVGDLAGLQPVSFRAPRLWQGQAQIEALEKHGFLVDASYSVFAHRKQVLPYHPAGRNWLESGDLKILEIPNYSFDESAHDFSPYFCKNDQWPLLRILGADFVFRQLSAVLERQGRDSDLRVLLFYLHPWEFVAMPDRYEYDEGIMHFRPELHQNCGESMAGSFSGLIELMNGEGFRFVSCRDFYQVWQGNGSARRREVSGRKGVDRQHTGIGVF
jgi:peptidoglycan/xylan/chitin deacetylase (PgdA/CDA1 family)